MGEKKMEKAEDDSHSESSINLEDDRFKPTRRRLLERPEAESGSDRRKQSRLSSLLTRFHPRPTPFTRTSPPAAPPFTFSSLCGPFGATSPPSGNSYEDNPTPTATTTKSSKPGKTASRSHTNLTHQNLVFLSTCPIPVTVPPSLSAPIPLFRSTLAPITKIP